ncbi:MAG TPA: MG2 domain-containing protein [Kofleriaceae bacterium]|nr:MG2 domain-containing protein [Kofleriaceae bacterium]
MTSRHIQWAAAAALTLVAACGGRGKGTGKGDLVVTSHSPAAARIDVAEPIQIQFDKPVAGEAEVGVPLATPPLTIHPAVPLAAQWADRQTLVVTPKAELDPSTRYRVELTGRLGERSGGFTFEFVNHPLEVDGVWGLAIDRLPPRPVLPLHFNQPVRAGDVIERCRVSGEAGAMPGLLTVDDRDAVADVVEVEPAVALTQGVDYRLTCDGLTGAGGAEPMTEGFSQLLHTYPTLSIAGVGPDGSDVPADDVEIEITLSTPVDLETLRKHLEAKPAIHGLARGALDAEGVKYRAVVSLEVETPYEIRITKGLTDVFGQKLDKTVEHDFVTGHARPRLSLETGIFAVEPSAGGYPVWTRSVGTFAVQCAAVPKASIVKLLTSEMDYDPWYDASSPDVVKWKALGMSAKKKKVTIADAKNNWHLEKIVMHETCGGAPRGLFLADFSSPDILMDPDRSWSFRPSRRVLANVTDLGVLLKAGPASGLIWVTSIATGKPVGGASVQVYAPTGKQVWSGTTDKDGLVSLPGSARLLGDKGGGEAAEGGDEEGWDSYRAQRLIAIVEKGEDLAAVDGNWANGIQTWNFGVAEDRGGGQTRVRGLIQSDRGIYRPGETVHFKGIAREIAIGRAASVPVGAPVEVVVTDSRGANILTKKLPLTRFGGFSFDLPVAEEAPTGDYAVVATIKKQVFRESFQVEEFRKVSFEVDVASPARHGSLGEKLLFNVSADFLFGAPVKDAKVTWEVQRRPHHLHFPRFPEYGFVDYAARGAYSWWYYDEESASEYTSFVSDGEAKTDARGKAAFAVRDPKSEFDGPQDYLARAVVTDESDQSVGKQVVVTAHPSEFYVGIHTQEFVQAVDMPFAVNTIALRPDGAQVGTKATMTFVRESWDCSWSGGYRSYSSCTDKHDTELTREITIPATGSGTERILPKKPGEYVIRVEATDARGAAVTSSSYVWVLGKGEAFWSGDEDARMSLIASKPQYKAGETAKIVPRTGMANPTALVTLERNGVLSARVISMESASEGIEIPITSAHAPNVFASVAMVSGRTGEGDRHRPRFKMGVIDLVVSSEENRLDVAIETERAKYQPGETVNGVVRLRSKGQPVVGEVALSVADEGVLQLIAYRTPDPMKTFFASWGLGVDAGTNWNRIARLNDPTTDDPEEGGDSGSAPEGRIRSKFLSSAFWAPHLVTDERGEVKFSFPAPDNLTAWRLMAVAADDGTRFGSGELRVTVAKPLLVKPVLPRFVGAGDKVEMGVVVHNYTGAAGTATVTAHATGASLGQETQTVLLADGASARVRFNATVKPRAAARFELAVAMGEHRDAMVMDVPIERGLVFDKKTLARGAVGGEGVPSQVEAALAWDKTVLPADSMLTVTVDRTGLGELEPSLRYLIEYPYGCLEQTLSRTIPMAKVKDLARSLEMSELDGPALKKYLRIGVAKVARHQHADGHFSLWPNSETYPHLTVYALYGLNEAKRAGVAVDERAVADGLAAMKRWAADGQRVLGANAESGTVAMAAYLMAELGAADTGLNARLFEVRDAIPRYGQAFLLMAMARAKAPAAQIATLKDEILTRLAAEGDAVLVTERIDMHHEMGSDVRSTAMTMSALLMVAPDHPVIEKLAEGLKQEQLPSGHWRNTQDNLFGLVALADYARTRASGTAKVVVKLDGKRLVARSLTGGKPVVLRRSLSGLSPGTITVESQGRALYAVRVTEARQDPATTPVAAGFTIVREYLDPETKLPVASPKANQLVRVRLTIKTDAQRHYVAVRDRLPAGLEPVNSRLATEAGDAADDDGGNHERWSMPTWVHTDLRDDGATAFADVLAAGEHVFEYNARATIPGTFRVLPAEVEAMYEPEIRGRTAGSQMVVRR